MAEPLRIGISDRGNVGAGVVKLLRGQSDLLSRRCGKALKIAAVFARDWGIDLCHVRWCYDSQEFTGDSGVDVLVEFIGGTDGVALDVVEGALAAGKIVVIANKAMMADHGTRLARTAEQTGASLAYEAAVEGGIPWSRRYGRV